jgi:hypothetical protein
MSGLREDYRTARSAVRSVPMFDDEEEKNN